MNGMQMMVDALLKAVGFSRDQFDEGVRLGKEKIEEYDRRFAAMEKNIGDIADNQRKESANAAHTPVDAETNG